ncbi:MAG: flagellar basal body P-ring formation chaperone FlgA [Proteobacteria bacterium]|nr:flagellar basal body P-ring formation chaperone FlgA [Pseudomonadota bacterium]
MRTVSTVLAFALLGATPALAGEAPALRAEAIVSGETVRFGDLVADAGPDAAIPLFRAPNLGGIGSIRVDRIAAAARELGLAVPDAKGLQAVMVRRPARTLGQEELEGAVRQALTMRSSELADAALTLDSLPAPIRIAAHGPLTPATIAAFDPKSGRFTAHMDGSSQEISGVASLTAAVPVLTRSIGRGDVIGAQDLAMKRLPRHGLPAGIVQDEALITGSIARRALAPGQPLREPDMMRPELVQKNQPVTVSYAMPGLSLTLRGKAMAGGPLGATVPVMNPVSKRIIETIVTGHGEVTARLGAKSDPAPSASR